MKTAAFIWTAIWAWQHFTYSREALHLWELLTSFGIMAAPFWASWACEKWVRE